MTRKALLLLVSMVTLAALSGLVPRTGLAAGGETPAPASPPEVDDSDLARLGAALDRDLQDEYEEFRLDRGRLPEVRFRDWLRDDWETMRDWGAGLTGGSVVLMGLGAGLSFAPDYGSGGGPQIGLMASGAASGVLFVIGATILGVYQTRLYDLEDALEPESADWLSRMEVVGMNLGAGYAGARVVREDGDGFPIGSVLVADLLLFTLRWDHVYWTLVEIKGPFLVGFGGGGGRAGVRIALSGDRRHELRLGVGLAGGLFSTWEGAVAAGPILTPHLQYVYNFRRSTVGMGVDVPIGFPVGGEPGDLAVGPMLYFRWSVN